MCIDSTDCADNSRQIGINVNVAAKSTAAESDTNPLFFTEDRETGLPCPLIAKLGAIHLEGGEARGKLEVHANCELPLALQACQ
jgi:hypothetical protein